MGTAKPGSANRLASGDIPRNTPGSEPVISERRLSVKRVTELWGKRFNGGYVLWTPRLKEALRFSDYVEYRGVTVTTKDLRWIIVGINTEDLLLRSNGGLEVVAIERYTRVNPDDPRTRIFAHRLAKNNHTYYLKNHKKTGGMDVILKIKIRPYGREKRG
jgi:hypothetical protein